MRIRRLSYILCFTILFMINPFGKGIHAQSVGFDIVGYRPAPGQFIDWTQFVQDGTDVQDLDEEKVCAKLNLLFAQYPNSYLLSLGGFGGSVTIRMKESLTNGEGRDFKVYGNALYEPNYTPSNSSRPGGSAEPGILWVSEDVNGNGLADDPWYEIAGSEYGSDTTEVRDYAVTYYRPSLDTMAILWRDNQGDSGYILRNDFHKQPSYFPIWISSDSVSYRGARLRDNAEWITLSSGSGKWVLFSYPWGYADNHSNMNDGSNIDIDWAVDSLGKPVYLEKIDFIRVVNAVNQYPSVLIGEISTEFVGVEPLHSPSSVSGDHRWKNWSVFPNPCSSDLYVSYRLSPGGGENRLLTLSLYNMEGRLLYEWGMNPGDTKRIDLSGWCPGVYILRDQTGRAVKVVRK